MARTLGCQRLRTETARAALVDATLALIAERGFLGFSLADVEARAGLSRSLAVYHFQSREGLVHEATASLLDDGEPRPEERGLRPMLEWLGIQVRLAAEADPRVLGTLQLATGAGADAGILSLRERYWRQRTDFIVQHLTSAVTLLQVHEGLVPLRAASMILGLLHGEQLRIVSTGHEATVDFSELLERALAPTVKPPRIGRGPLKEEPQLGLF